MRVRIEKGIARGTVEAPPSKSMAHRLLICAGLAGGKSVIHGIAASEDVLATLDCLAALGVRCEVGQDAAVIYGKKFRNIESPSTIVLPKAAPKSELPEATPRLEPIKTAPKSELPNAAPESELPKAAPKSEPTKEAFNFDSREDVLLEKEGEKRILNCRESGSTLRFFLPICLAIGGKSRLTGKGRLPQRPQDVYKIMCAQQGISFEQDEAGITVCGRLAPGTFTLPGNVSSQFVSGLLFALPLLSGDSRIEITPPIESRPYIDMTISALAAFGVKASWQDENTIFVKGSQDYIAAETAVEGDYSNAAFLDALNVLGGGVKVTNRRPDSLQGDRVYKQLFEQIKYMNMADHDKPIADERIADETLADKPIDISDCPDLGPVLFAVAALCGGGHFTGCRRLKIKESDRAAAMAAELAKLGVAVEVSEDEVVVGIRADAESLGGSENCAVSAVPKEEIRLEAVQKVSMEPGVASEEACKSRDALETAYESDDGLGAACKSEVGFGISPPTDAIDGHNDHRIVMAMAVLLTLTGGEIEGAEAVNKSFPDFFKKLEKLGIEVREIEN